jgi:hypothetical protein
MPANERTEKMQTYITKTTAHKYLDQPFFVNELNTGAFTIEADGYEFGFACFSEDDAIADAEYKIWNRVACNGIDAIS